MDMRIYTFVDRLYVFSHQIQKMERLSMDVLDQKTYKWKKISKVSGCKINILKPVIILMHSLPKVMYRFHVIPITIQLAFFFPTDKVIWNLKQSKAPKQSWERIKLEERHFLLLKHNCPYNMALLPAVMLILEQNWTLRNKNF